MSFKAIACRGGSEKRSKCESSRFKKKRKKLETAERRARRAASQYELEEWMKETIKIRAAIEEVKRAAWQEIRAKIEQEKQEAREAAEAIKAAKLKARIERKEAQKLARARLLERKRQWVELCADTVTTDMNAPHRG